MAALSNELWPPSATIDGDDLLLGGCSLRAVAAGYGTPAYVIDERALRQRAQLFRTTFATLHADSHATSRPRPIRRRR